MSEVESIPKSSGFRTAHITPTLYSISQVNGNIVTNQVTATVSNTNPDGTQTHFKARSITAMSFPPLSANNY